MDVGRAVDFAKQHGFFEKTVLVIASECHKAILELKAAGRPIVLVDDPLHREENPYTGEITETFVPKMLADAGLTFALSPASSANLAERHLNYQAARCRSRGRLARGSTQGDHAFPCSSAGAGIADGLD